MVAAPHSCLVATKRAPPAISALVTWKLPLPTTPKTVSMPSRARALPTASATSMRPPGGRSALDQGEHAGGAAGAADDRQWAGDHHGALWGQLGEVLELRQPVPVGAEQERVAGERRVEARGGSSVGANGLDADADDRRLLRQPPGALDRDAWRVRAGLVDVAEQLVVVGACVPAGAVEQPATLGQGAVLALPLPDVIDLQAEVRVALDLGGEVEDRCGRHQAPGRHLRDVVPVPRRPALVVVADLPQAEGHGVGERLGQLQDRRLVGQRRGQVEDLDRAAADPGDKAAQHRHALLLPARPSVRAEATSVGPRLPTPARFGSGTLQPPDAPGRAEWLAWGAVDGRPVPPRARQLRRVEDRSSAPTSPAKGAHHGAEATIKGAPMRK